MNHGAAARDRRLPCRKLRVESVARGSSSSHSYPFCRRGDGPWGIGQPAD